MNRLMHKTKSAQLRQQRVRSRIHGTAERPRLSVHISLRHVSAQLIDDNHGKTIVFVSSVGMKNNDNSITKKSMQIGKELAVKAKKAGIKNVVFDRGNKLYHGRIKAFADAARAEGLEF